MNEAARNAWEESLWLGHLVVALEERSTLGHALETLRVSGGDNARVIATKENQLSRVEARLAAMIPNQGLREMLFTGAEPEDHLDQLLAQAGWPAQETAAEAAE